MKVVLALVLALGMTSTSFAENFNDEKENIPMGSEHSADLVAAVAETLVSIPGATVSTVVNALKALFGESIPVDERVLGRMLDENRGR